VLEATDILSAPGAIREIHRDGRIAAIAGATFSSVGPPLLEPSERVRRLADDVGMGFDALGHRCE